MTDTITFDFDVETFAAERNDEIDDAIALVRPAVADALEGDDTVTDLMEAAIALFRSLGGTRESAFRQDMRPAILRTEPDEDNPQAQIDRISNWLAVAATGARDFYGADVGATKTWITMLDDDVRDLHREVHGVTVAARDMFDLDGVPTQYPGQPVGPPSHWINCRCVLRVSQAPVTAAGLTFNTSSDLRLNAGFIQYTGGSMSGPISFAADTLETVEDYEDDPPPPEELIGADAPMQWHSIITVEGTPSGDRRQFATDSLTWRDLPLPLEWQRVTADEHNGAVVVGRIDGLQRAGNQIRSWGVFAHIPDADDVIGLIADQHIRGISPTVDDIEMSADLGDDERPIRTLAKGRICSGTIVNVPAFAEAFLRLGPPPEEWLAMAASGENYRQYDADQRKEMAKRGTAMPDGSYPIADVDDLRNAIQAIGRASDPEATKAHIRKRAKALNHPELIPDTWAAESEDFARGPGWVTHPVATRRIHRYWTRGKGAAKIGWGTPHDFYRCRRQLGKYVKANLLNQVCAQWHHDALGYWPGQGPHGGHSAAETEAFETQTPPACDCDTLVTVASAAPARSLAPAGLFRKPPLTGPTPLSVEDGRHLFGHLATFTQCHIGIDGSCIVAPKSRTNYAYFHTGVIDTDEGEIPVGVLTMDTMHAGRSLGAHAAMAHYENTGTMVAAVCAGEDEWGIWISGLVLPLPENDYVRLRAASVSGDWRWIGGNLELVGALVVNVPGFPVPRPALAASAGRVEALVAAGVVPPRDPDDVMADRVLARLEQRAARKATAERLAAFASDDRSARVARLVAAEA